MICDWRGWFRFVCMLDTYSGVTPPFTYWVTEPSSTSLSLNFSIIPGFSTHQSLLMYIIWITSLDPVTELLYVTCH